MNSILIIEDETDLAELLAFNIEQEGYRPLIAHDGITGLDKASSCAPDLVLLDLMLPGISGIQICKTLKGNDKTAGIPIIILTAKGEEIDRVVGLEIGADDYVVKPFSTRELMLRIKRVLMHTCNVEKSGRISIGPITIDANRHIVAIAGTEIVLTTIEYKLLLNLAARAGKVMSRDLLLKDVWGMAHTADTRTVDTHITRLRTKLGEAGKQVKTVRGFGYRLDEN